MDDPSACLKVAACICATDGVISEAEERTLVRIFRTRYPDFNDDDIERALIEFFDSDNQIEDFLALVKDQELRNFTLRLAEESASADGLDIRENIALNKAYLIWGTLEDA